MLFFIPFIFENLCFQIYKTFVELNLVENVALYRKQFVRIHMKISFYEV